MLHLKCTKDTTSGGVFMASSHCAFLVQKEQRLGDGHFEDRSRQLKELPSLSTDFYIWLKLTVCISRIFSLFILYIHRNVLRNVSPHAFFFFFTSEELGVLNSFLLLLCTRTGKGWVLLWGTYKPTGTCWRGRENSWRRRKRRRKSRWRDRCSATLCLKALNTSSWTCKTWWAKLATRYLSSSHSFSLSQHHQRSNQQFSPSSCRWGTFRAPGWSRLHLQETQPWAAKATPKQRGTAEWRVTSFWGIWTFTSPSWRETSSWWLPKATRGSSEKKEGEDAARTKPHHSRWQKRRAAPLKGKLLCHSFSHCLF